jgi:hypothetical protein
MFVTAPVASLSSFAWASDCFCWLAQQASSRTAGMSSKVGTSAFRLWSPNPNILRPVPAVDTPSIGTDYLLRKRYGPVSVDDAVNLARARDAAVSLALAGLNVRQAA